jgi:hypothetical protein
MGLTADLGAVKWRKIPAPAWNRTPTVQPAGDSFSDFLSSCFQANTGKYLQIDADSLLPNPCLLAVLTETGTIGY